MTIAQLVECLAGKRMCATAEVGSIKVRQLFEQTKDEKTIKKLKKNPDSDGTPFSKEFSLDRIIKELKEMGLNEFGEEICVNGMTGETMPCLMFYGPVYYQRLKHMTVDKVHSRTRKGGRTALTRQPREGRSKAGGMKFGNMEKDSIMAQGASGFIRDRLMEQSNDYRIWVCAPCGTSLVVDKSGRKSECPLCNSNEASYVRIPYATKLLSQEFATANIITRIVTKPFSEETIEI